MAYATCKITWLSYLLHSLGIPRPQPASHGGQSVLHIAADPIYIMIHEWTKHIEIKTLSATQTHGPTPPHLSSRSEGPDPMKLDLSSQESGPNRPNL